MTSSAMPTACRIECAGATGRLKSSFNRSNSAVGRYRCIVCGIGAVIMISLPIPAGLNQIAPVFGIASWREPAPLRLTRLSWLPATTKQISTCWGTIGGASQTPCDRSSTDRVDQPSPADEASNRDAGGNFLTPWVRRSIELSEDFPPEWILWTADQFRNINCRNPRFRNV